MPVTPAVVNTVKKKIWKPLIALLVLLATIIGILANWEDAWLGLQKLMGKL